MGTGIGPVGRRTGALVAGPVEADCVAVMFHRGSTPLLSSRELVVAGIVPATRPLQEIASGATAPNIDCPANVSFYCDRGAGHSGVTTLGIRGVAGAFERGEHL